MKTICNKCKNEVYDSDIPGYSFECDNCDESLYKMEVTEVAENDDDKKLLELKKQIEIAQREQLRDLAVAHLEGGDNQTDRDIKKMMAEITENDPLGDDNLDYDTGYYFGYKLGLYEALLTDKFINLFTENEKNTDKKVR